MSDFNGAAVANRRVAALTIAGSDSGGNAGIQADLRAFHVFGVHGCTVLSALTAQNPFEVREVVLPEPEFVGVQLDLVLGVYGVNALKTGMLATAEIIEVVAGRLISCPRIPKVCDPVMVATSGAKLLDPEAVKVLQEQLLPLAMLVTPNLPEAEELLGQRISGLEETAVAARKLAEKLGCAVLIKGGHATGAKASDLLFDGEKLLVIAAPRFSEPLSTHGTGCSLSAAITAALAGGKSLVEAVIEGKAYVHQSIADGVWVGEVATCLGTPKQLPTDIIEVSEYR